MSDSVLKQELPAFELDRLREYLNLGGWPLLHLEGKRIQCDADPNDVHDIYGPAHRQGDARIFCEFHSNKTLIAALRAEIERLKGGKIEAPSPETRQGFDGTKV